MLRPSYQSLPGCFELRNLFILVSTVSLFDVSKLFTRIPKISNVFDDFVCFLFVHAFNVFCLCVLGVVFYIVQVLWV